jgi:glycine cleavage system H protein
LKVKNYDIPEGLLYTKEHEWARIQADLVIIGITDYAAKTLNDVVYVSLPKLGENLKQFASFGTVESIKAVSELYSPCSGIVSKVNSELNMHPELTNQSPYSNGWLLELKAKDFDAEKKNLLSPNEYAKYLDSMK